MAKTLKRMRHPKKIIIIAAVIVFVLLVYNYRMSNARNSYSAALIHIENARYDDAIQILTKILRDNPADLQSRYALGNAYQAKGWLDEAVNQYNVTAFASVEMLSQDFAQLGVIEIQKTQLEKALDYFKRALEVNPENVFARKNVETLSQRLHKSK